MYKTVAKITKPRFFIISGQFLIVPERSSGKIYAINVNSQVQTQIISGLDDPTSIALDKDRHKLYIGEHSRLSVVDLSNGRYQKLLDLPTDGGHSTRTIVLDYPFVYISVGSSCNSCIEKDPRRATILRYNIRNKITEIFAKGLRNAVGLAIYNHKLYATVNERDWLGDDFPNDILVYVPYKSNFGWPYCNVSQPDPVLGKSDSCINVPKPIWRFAPHSAPLGLTWTSKGWLVALHGSWNRTTQAGPTGHQVVLLEAKHPEHVIREIEFVRMNRPVGVQIKGNNVYISDDEDNKIYRYVWLQ